MSIHELAAVVRPPSSPLEAGPAERWEAVQQQLGTRLPNDIRDFGLTYGTGRFVEQGIIVLNPFAAVYFQELEGIQMAWRSLKQGEGDREVPFSLYPQTPGLLPWGQDDQGAGTFWLTKGDPDHWPILVRGHEEATYHRFEMEVTSFLARVMKSEIILRDIWPPEIFHPSRLVFQPQDLRPKDYGALRNIYQLYVENGMRAGFWVQHENWEGSGTEIRVKSVNGVTEGPLTGDPPYFGEGIVLVDVFESGSLFEENVELPIATDQGFRQVRKPEK